VPAYYAFKVLITGVAIPNTVPFLTRPCVITEWFLDREILILHSVAENRYGIRITGFGMPFAVTPNSFVYGLKPNHDLTEKPMVKLTKTPSPQEIEKMCENIRMGWTENEYRKRSAPRPLPIYNAATGNWSYLSHDEYSTLGSGCIN